MVPSRPPDPSHLHRGNSRHRRTKCFVHAGISHRRRGGDGTSTRSGPPEEALMSPFGLLLLATLIAALSSGLARRAYGPTASAVIAIAAFIIGFSMRSSLRTHLSDAA